MGFSFLLVVASAPLSNRVAYVFFEHRVGRDADLFLFHSVLSYCNARSGIISNLLHNFVS